MDRYTWNCSTYRTLRICTWYTWKNHTAKKTPRRVCSTSSWSGAFCCFAEAFLIFGGVFFLGHRHHLFGWWFGTCFIFHNIWDNPSPWLSYFSEELKPPNSYPFFLFWIVLRWVNDSVSCLDFNTCEHKVSANPIPNLNSATSSKTGGMAIAPENAVSLEFLVAFWHLQHLSKRQRRWIQQNTLSWKEQRSTRKNRKFRGLKTAEKGGKTAEKGGKMAVMDGLWKLRSKSCRKHVQKAFITDFAILLAFFPLRRNFVDSYI